jgi:hypothetical protein
MAAQAQAAASAEAQSITQAAVVAVTGTKVRQLDNRAELAVSVAVAMAAEALQHRPQALQTQAVEAAAHPTWEMALC